MNGIELAIESAGGLSKLAERLGVKPQVIFNWRKRGIPAERVLDVERMTSIPRHELRPDIYPTERVA